MLRIFEQGAQCRVLFEFMSSDMFWLPLWRHTIPLQRVSFCTKTYVACGQFQGTWWSFARVWLEQRASRWVATSRVWLWWAPSPPKARSWSWSLRPRRKIWTVHEVVLMPWCIMMPLVYNFLVRPLTLMPIIACFTSRPELWSSFVWSWYGHGIVMLWSKNHDWTLQSNYRLHIRHAFATADSRSLPLCFSSESRGPSFAEIHPQVCTPKDIAISYKS